MTIAKDFASKFAVAFVAAAMIFSAIAPAVQAAEADDLQTTINDLLAQVAALQSQLGDDTTTTTTTTTTTSSCDVPMAPLTVGSQGGGVTGLQERLIADGHAIAAGATGYFGAQTKAALAAWQAANNVAPAVGYYGPITAAAMKASCTPADDSDDDSDDSDDTDSGELQGEGEITSIEVDDADETDIEEGAEDAEIAVITIEAEDGDVEISRIDLDLGTGTEDPWDVFETFSLWVDGEMIGEFDAADDEDEYLNETSQTFRISGLDLVVMEDEDVDIVVAATVASSVDTLEDWTLEVEEVRSFDADGVADDVTTSTGVATFDIVAEGDGDDLELSESSDSPEEGTIVLDESDSVEEMIFAFELDADDSDRDVTLNEVVVDIAISSSTDVDDVVEDFYIMIGDEKFDAEIYTGTAATAAITFDVDGDVEIGAGELVTVEVFAEFGDMDTDDVATQGVSITASVDTNDIDAEGADDITVGGSDQDGEAQTLRSTGLYAADAPTTETDSEDGVGTFEFTFELTAIEEPMYVSQTAATSFDWTVTGGAGTTTATLQSDADVVSGFYKIAAGQSEEFTLVVTHDPAAAGSYYVTLDDITYKIDSVSAANQTYVLSPSSEWDTSAVSISAS